MWLVASTVLAFTVSVWLTWRLTQPGSLLYILDHPNSRSLHSRPTPRTGGIAILAAVYGVGIIAVAAQPATFPVWPLASAGLVLSTVAYVDDRRSLAPGIRLLIHMMVALGLVASGLVFTAIDLPGYRIELGQWIGTVMAVAWIVWMTNLYNFMDGMDGYAGGMAVAGFGAFAVFGWIADDSLFTLVNAIIAAAALGFLVFNFPPARIFMGDTGSLALGCFAASGVIWGSARGIFSTWIGVLVFSPFIVDATATLLRRLLQGARVWEAHRTHYYQRLVRLGWGHRRTVLLQYGFMLGCCVSAGMALIAPVSVQWGVIVFWLAVYALYFITVSALETRTRGSGPSSGTIA